MQAHQSKPCDLLAQQKKLLYILLILPVATQNLFCEDPNTAVRSLQKKKGFESNSIRAAVLGTKV